jgi:hypothetical protein
MDEQFCGSGVQVLTNIIGSVGTTKTNRIHTASVRQARPGLGTMSRAKARPDDRLTTDIFAEAGEQRRECFDVGKRGAEVHDAGSQREFSIDDGIGQECFTIFSTRVSNA